LLPDLSEPVGDLTNNSVVTAEDIDNLFAAIQSRVAQDAFDWNGDGTVSQEDATHLVKNVLKTSFGDANLDGVFNSADLVQVFQSGEYEDSVADNSNWSEGDWNGDRQFDSSDLVLAFQDQGFLAEAISAQLNRA
jgi:hypothetical protein